MLLSGKAEEQVDSSLVPHSQQSVCRWPSAHTLPSHSPSLPPSHLATRHLMEVHIRAHCLHVGLQAGSNTAETECGGSSQVTQELLQAMFA
jgi:hypothetical protein